jgi:hypothetical protein
LLRSCQNTHTQIKRRRKSLKQKDATERECVTNGGLKGTKQRTKHYGNETKNKEKENNKQNNNDHFLSRVCG